MRYRFKQSLIYALLALLLMSTFNGCSRKNDAKRGGSQSITVAGSTSVQPFAEQWAEEYMKKNPGKAVNVQGGGSTAGIQSAISGVADIGTSSRELKEKERESLQYRIVALDGIAVIVNPENKVNALTTEQITDIFSKERPRWNDYGGSGSEIHAVSREEGSGTRSAFQEMVMKKQLIHPAAMVQDSNGSVREMVAGDPQAIGYISLDLVNEKVKAVKIDGVDPTVANVENGTYKIVRPFIFAFKSTISPEGKAFIDFVTSDENQTLIREEGLIPVKK
jgi:phosphate transport system substrate-binding protein